ncbi:hypothetical protein L210DRAFT_3518417 [Boletus edulis BED1]|uniref:Uncharacterized protein n=1 Tax=Boletus edulis BED1 TaxID=1328754 RepID=A0AAD4C8W6_BOLED|nr:hypothetical protein L210DRAFT_3518417 [Boletus edulis BED1]
MESIMMMDVPRASEHPFVACARAGGRLHSGNLGCKVTTFGKQHRSCKHPIHMIPLVEWHCGKRTCHVRLVICVEL